MFKPGLNLVIVPNEEELFRIISTVVKLSEGNVVSLLASHYLSLKLSYTLDSEGRNFYMVKVGGDTLRATIVFTGYLSREDVGMGVIDDLALRLTASPPGLAFRGLAFTTALIRWASLESGKPCVWVITSDQGGLFLKIIGRLLDRVIYAL